MKKLILILVFSFGSTMLYAQNPIKGVQNAVRSIPKVITGVRRAANISTEVSAAAAASTANTTGKVQIGNYDQKSSIPTPEHPVTPTPLSKELPLQWVHPALPLQSPEATGSSKAIAEKLSAISDTIKR